MEDEIDAACRKHGKREMYSKFESETLKEHGKPRRK
jgi:hypothetical protein